jgi:hypothetical protein
MVDIHYQYVMGASIGLRARGAATVAIFNKATRLSEPAYAAGAQDKGQLQLGSFMGRASLGLVIGIFYDVLYRALTLNAIPRLDFSGLALCRPQVPADRDRQDCQPGAGEGSRAGEAAVGRSLAVGTMCLEFSGPPTHKILAFSIGKPMEAPETTSSYLAALRTPAARLPLPAVGAPGGVSIRAHFKPYRA